MQTKAGSMPPDNSLWPDNGDNAQRRRKQPIKLDEDQSIDHRQRRLTARTLAQHVQLMPQQDDLSLQTALGWMSKRSSVSLHRNSQQCGMAVP
jgi:hypothetical protein